MNPPVCANFTVSVSKKKFIEANNLLYSTATQFGNLSLEEYLAEKLRPAESLLSLAEFDV